MKYFEGVRVYAVPVYPFTSRRCAITWPGVGIFCSPCLVDNIPLLRHEFGHVLQRRYFGWWFYWFRVAPVSFLSAVRAACRWMRPFFHADTWTEWSANRLSYAYFHQPADWSDVLFPRRVKLKERRWATKFPSA